MRKVTLLIHITVIYVHSRLRWRSYSKQLPEYEKCFILHGIVTTVFMQSGLSVHCQLQVTFLMLPTKIYKHTLKFVKIINRNTVSFFHLGY